LSNRLQRRLPTSANELNSNGTNVSNNVDNTGPITYKMGAF